ncbi:ribosomal-processing cysteine protease Prp [Paenibacillus massiliensis]|uniref:ribosomal-processing cysteine protease Prp n=1 Tax=Paenibacillus massiliensis TaxID=225917 RepID=UPI00036A42D7
MHRRKFGVFAAEDKKQPNASGETGFTQYGLDIIAAGVSALIINTMHSLEYLTEELMEADLQKNYCKCILPDLQTKNRGSKEATVLLQSLEIGIHSLQNTYGEKLITIEKIYEKQKAGLFKLFK